MRFGVREILFLVILFGIPLAAYQYVFKPRNAEIRQARTEIEGKLSRLEQLSLTTARINDLDIAIERGREAIDVVEAKLPSAQNVDEVLRQAWKIARRYDLSIQNVEPEKRVPASKYMELPIKVELFGNFDGFYEFLRDLEQLPRLTRIKDLHMKRSDDGNGLMEADFKLSIFYEPDRENSGSKSLARANQ